MSSTVPLSTESPVFDPRHWLTDRRFQIVGASEEDFAIDPHNRLANFLGDHAHVSRLILRSIKHRLNGKALPVSLDLSKLGPPAIELILRFLREAYRGGLLKYFYREKRYGRVKFLLQDDPLVARFFTGGWFESYVLERVVRGLTRLGAGDETPVLTKTNIRAADGADFEIDILTAVHHRILFFECKSGNNLASDLLRYRALVRDSLRLSPEHAALVVFEPLALDEKINLAYLSGMSVVNIADLDQFLRRAVVGGGHAA